MHPRRLFSAARQRRHLNWHPEILGFSRGGLPLRRKLIWLNLCDSDPIGAGRTLRHLNGASTVACPLSPVRQHLVSTTSLHDWSCRDVAKISMWHSWTTLQTWQPAHFLSRQRKFFHLSKLFTKFTPDFFCETCIQQVFIINADDVISLGNCKCEFVKSDLSEIFTEELTERGSYTYDVC